jgi:hypothetical protein
MKEKLFYKYRTLKNFQRFEDIIKNNKLYAAVFKDLNDTNEGEFARIGDKDIIIRDKIREAKFNLRICSLTTTSRNELMWHFYADNHKGVVIEVEDSFDDKVEIQYVPFRIKIEYNTVRDCAETAKEILSRKRKLWNFEQEVRVFTEEEYVRVKIKKIILGKCMEDEDVNRITELVKKVNPKIEICERTIH